MYKSRLKKLLLAMIVAASMLVLSGCSFSDLMSWGTGVKQDPDYQTWEKLSEKGKLDQDGKYTADAVHVTFATSSFFDMKYYKDPEMEDELPSDNCYLLPGDMIYCSARVRNDVANYYVFDHLDVIEYQENNLRGQRLDWKYPGDPAVLMIPFDYKGTEVSIEPIGHYKLITVRLEQPAFGGHVSYKVNGQELTGETAELYRGAKINGYLDADPGWELSLNMNPVYIVTDEENQIVTFEGNRADSFFMESADHKPTLRFEVNRNLKSCRTTIEADGYSAKGLAAGNGGVVVDNQKVGTGKEVSVSFSHFDLEKGKNAVRLTVLKKTDNTEYKEIYYANENNSTVRISFEYEVTYKSVSVVAEAVTVTEIPAVDSRNADVAAYFCDLELDNPAKNTPLVAGSLGTNDRQIEVRITPDDGFVMTGSFVSDGVYLRKMRFDEYGRFVREALDKQLKKTCKIQLKDGDMYGSAAYRVDGQEVSGSVELMEGQSITIVYTLKNKDYEIRNDRNLFDRINIFDGDRWTRYEKTIPVDRSMDGQTLSRESFGIVVGKKVK